MLEADTVARGLGILPVVETTNPVRSTTLGTPRGTRAGLFPVEVSGNL